ncbi:glycosyltransferase family 2 protein [Terriglobus tenax]|uniref:glycosyltransferase family 2 protein n=1 Tax=Terriglobus tenax TaxID=1111115 RepID=UPI0021E06176|nr:glycosyltransferase family 2 protein [Terriglobus tenax]
MRPSVIILAYNSADSLPATLASVSALTDDIHVVDSGSTDGTPELAKAAGAQVLHHAFESYGAQRNWAIANCPIKYGWQLHLDADERLTPELATEIAALPEQSTTDGFFLPRYLQFLGRILRHGGMSPTWHMRLFQSGKGSCEVREYDQHFICTGTTSQLKYSMIDDIRMPLTEWTYRHNRWSDAEVREQLKGETAGRVGAKMTGNVIEKKRALREMYNNLPYFVRPFGLWFYRYVVRLGFLDGMEGFIFYTLQTFWFRFLIDAKLWEARNAKQ